MSEPTPKLRVLVVDDEPLMSGLFQRVLGNDYAVVTAANGEEALAKLAAEQFDVVVTDTDMPGMWGPELLDEVQRRWPAIARVIMSGDNQGVARTAYDRGVAHVFMAKPWDTGEPQAAIVKALGMVATKGRDA